MNVIEAIEKEQLRSDIPDFRPGDTLKVYVKVVEGNRERVQLFPATVLVSVKCSPSAVSHPVLV